MSYMLFLWCVATIWVISDAQLHPIQTQDLHSIVESVKKDVDRHLEMASSGQHTESVSLPDASERQKAAIEDIDDFMTMIQDSMHHHLVKNLGPPSDAGNDESTVYSQPKTESTNVVLSTEFVPDNSSEHPEVIYEGTLESSSEVNEISVGSLKGVRNLDFPDYTDIPITSFTCSDKAHLPGFYADLDTGCQVFHVCWPERRESFLCPMGTIFNQAFLACDYWYNSNCSMAPYYYIVNTEMGPDSSTVENESSMISTLLEKTESDSTSKPEFWTDGHETAANVLSLVSQFMPIKAKIVVYPETLSQRAKIVASASIGQSNRKGSKSKSSPKHKVQFTSKPFTLPISDKHEKASATEVGMAKFKSKIFAVKFIEAIDQILFDAKSDSSLSKLLWYVEGTVKFLKVLLEDYMRRLPELDFEPESELYEFQSVITDAFKMLPIIVKKLLISIVTFMDEAECRMTDEVKEILYDGHKHATLKHAALTHLNSRFIIKPAVEQQKYKLSKPVKVTTKRDTTSVNPLKLSHKGHLSIYPRTKKALLKNYVKLFKTKRA